MRSLSLCGSYPSQLIYKQILLQPYTQKAQNPTVLCREPVELVLGQPNKN